MVTSLILFSVAAGILIAALAYGFGGIFPILVAISLFTVVAKLAMAARRRAPEAFSS